MGSFGGSLKIPKGSRAALRAALKNAKPYSQAPIRLIRPKP